MLPFIASFSVHAEVGFKYDFRLYRLSSGLLHVLVHELYSKSTLNKR